MLMMESVEVDGVRYHLLGEGGANVVVSCEDGFCLRLAKRVKAGGKARYGTVANHSYATEAMVPLLGAEYVDAGEVVPASRDFAGAASRRPAADGRPRRAVSMHGRMGLLSLLRLPATFP